MRRQILYQWANRICLDCDSEFKPYFEEKCPSCGSLHINCLFDEDDPFFGWKVGEEYIDIYGRNIIWTGTRIHCKHNLMFYQCTECSDACIHGIEKPSKKCVICNGCVHGLRKDRCLQPECDVKGKNNARRIAGRIRGAVARGKSIGKEYENLLGCTLEELKLHLELQFGGRMSWENIEEWHLDHRMPMSRFNLTDPLELEKCFHFTNYQPLWADDNIVKSDNTEEELIWTEKGWANQHG